MSQSVNVTIAATVESRFALKWIRLRYRHMTQFEDYQSVDMTLNPDTGIFVAAIPGSFIIPEWSLMYYVEALPKTGDGRMAPDMEEEMPYVIVPVKR